MTDLKSQILKEVETELGSGAVMDVADAMEKCPTLAKVIELSEKADIGRYVKNSVELQRIIGGLGK